MTIALTAYVLINTTVTAITGYKVTSQNPFGVIGSVFGNVSGTIQKQTNYEQAFSGPKTKTGTSTTTTPPAGSTTGCADATSDWDKTCTPGNLYSHCADPVDGGSSDIKVMQKDLNDLGCPKIDVDGCFGAQTIDAVRRFQIANKLPPSGMIDSSTRAKIIAGGSSCTLVLSGGVDIAAAVAGTLPAAADLSAEDAAKSDTGCCVVKSTTNDYYCLDNIPYRACIGLGESNDFYSNGGSTSNTCNSSSMPTSTRCGYCKVAPVTTSGFFCNQQVSEYWCTNVISPLVGSSGDTYDTFFNTGLCNGAPACNGMCTNTITPNE